MNAICRWGFQFGFKFGLALAAVSFISVVPTSVHAYTPEQQQACSPDAMRLCGDFVPDVDRITACMIQKKSQLSPECRRYFRPGPEPGEASAEPPPNFKRVGPAPKAASTKKKPKKPAKPADT